MAYLKPFCAIRPDPACAALAAAPPYDVFSRTEASTYVNTHPASFLRIDRPETMFPNDIDMYAPEVYQKGREAFLQLLASGTYLKESTDCYYLYELKSHNHIQTGIVGCASASDYESGVIKTHEKTRKDKEEDRIRHIATLNLQASPLFLTYRADHTLTKLMAEAKSTPYLYHFTDEDKITHTIWAISNSKWIQTITDCFAAMPALYIADGHHRAASGDAVARSRRTAGSSKNCESEFLMSILFPDNELKIYPYHRIVCGINSLTPAQFLEKIQERCTLIPSAEPVLPVKAHEIGMYFHKKWYILRAMEKFLKQDPSDGLDVAFLQREILKPVLGITDPRTDPRIRFLGGDVLSSDLEELARKTPDGIAFAMCPITTDEFFQVADHALLMPPKSTWFAPKPLSGLLLHEL